MIPGLRVGYLRAPADRLAAVMAALGATTLLAPPLMAHIASRWIADGTADGLAKEKRREMAQRQEIVRRIFAGQDYRSDPAAGHCWLSLPENWRAEEFAAAARRRSVGITPAAAFAIGRHAPNAVRVCIGPPATTAALEQGLLRLVELSATMPETYLSIV
jgi:DNA-binding transcriptional MocR family regulator